MRGRTIKLYIMGEEYKNLKSVELSNWSGKAYIGSRKHVGILQGFEDLSAPGVYCLIAESEDSYQKKIYIGEADEINKRLNEHHKKKDWWENCEIISSNVSIGNCQGTMYLQSIFDCLKKLNILKGEIMETIVSALLVFVSTSIDYLVVLTILFTSQGKEGLKSIYAGQYLGTGLLVLVSLIAAYFLNFIPQDWIIGLLGLIPLGLGIRSIFVDEDIDEEDIEGKITRDGSKILAFTSLTVAMGGDNLGIYIPYFTGKSLIEIGISLVIFTLGILILCKLSQSLASISAIGEIVEKYEKIIVPVVFIGLGLYILIENGTINYFISLITS